MLSSRLEIRSFDASSSAGVACLRLAWGLGACVRVCARAWLCLGATGCVSAGVSRAHSLGGGQPGLSEPLGLGWLRPDLSAAEAKARRAVRPQRSREARPRPRPQRKGAKYGTAHGPSR